MSFTLSWDELVVTFGKLWWIVVCVMVSCENTLLRVVRLREISKDGSTRLVGDDS